MNPEKPLPSLDNDLDLWLNLLADDELSAGQRRELIRHLDGHPEYWQACARVFLDQQTLQKAVVLSPSVPQPMVVSSEYLPCGSGKSVNVVASRYRRSSRDNHSRPRQLKQWLTIAGCLALIGFGGFWGGTWSGYSKGQQESRLELERASQQIAQYKQESGAGGSPASSLVSHHDSSHCELVERFLGQPMLVELENTPSRALYVTNREIPRSLLDCFAAAGFEVDIQPYEPKFMNPFQTPVVAIEVSKRSTFHLLASGEPK